MSISLNYVLKISFKNCRRLRYRYPIVLPLFYLSIQFCRLVYPVGEKEIYHPLLMLVSPPDIPILNTIIIISFIHGDLLFITKYARCRKASQNKCRLMFNKGYTINFFIAGKAFIPCGTRGIHKYFQLKQHVAARSIFSCNFFEPVRNYIGKNEFCR